MNEYFNTKPLEGMSFVRTGDFNYQKKIGEFVTSLGGSWVKSTKHATAGVNGRANIMHAKNWTKKIAELLEQNKPIVVLECTFGGDGKNTAEMVNIFLTTLEIAKTNVCSKINVGTSAADIAKAYRDAFPNIKETYHPQTAAEFWAEQPTDEGCSADAVLTQTSPGGLKWSKPPNW